MALIEHPIAASRTHASNAVGDRVMSCVPDRSGRHSAPAVQREEFRFAPTFPGGSLECVRAEIERLVAQLAVSRRREG